jgi:hypothetical protein
MGRRSKRSNCSDGGGQEDHETRAALGDSRSKRMTPDFDKVLGELETERKRTRELLDRLETTIAVITMLKLSVLVDGSDPAAIVKAVQDMMRV